MRYDAVISRKDKDGKVRYTKIGAAFPAKDGKDGFNIVLDALPMPNAEGQAWISLYVPKPKEDADQHDQRPISERAQEKIKRPDTISTGRGGDMDDQIPF
ncbi:hypothetical protein IVB27_32300 [Bradyrhizobium sp. 197]|uniref:hypothetical protein n=1 Tax=Bradyrhizobium sp. 197 TaxID=2782663 RepID=UPI001FF86FBE|nr:hypothetical protein [Bradyrhizobium sp. 197]MCK1479296.1 hypothetical protein [Bradyrhizobium sp. 197]